MTAATSLRLEFDRQVESLHAKHYPDMAGLSAEAFSDELEPLREYLGDLSGLEEDRDTTHTPFVIVVTRELVDITQALARVERAGKSATTVLPPEDIVRFQPLPDLSLPSRAVYLLVDIEPGLVNRNVTPDAALSLIQKEGRFPLTLEEGVALVTHYPDLVKKNYGFSLLGSRAGDRRVAAWWLSEGRPKLGWCWAGNPHTWLGSASARQRLGS